MSGKYLWSFVAMLQVACCCAGSEIFLGNLAPFASLKDGKAVGLAVEVVAELQVRMGRHQQIVVVPLARVLTSASGEAEVVTFMARTPFREQQFQWLVPVAEESFHLFARADSTHDIHNAEAARNIAVGVTRSSIGAQLARDFKLNSVQEAATDETNLKKLMAGRIDAWLGGLNVAMASLQRTGIDQARIRRSEALARYDVWLAASHALSPAEADAWRKAFAEMKADGTYARIMKSYPQQ